MFGILLFICILAVFGFVLSWIAGVIAHEEVSIPKSMAIIFTNGVISFLIGMGLDDAGVIGAIVQFAASLATLGALLWVLAGIPFKKGVIIAAIFAVLMLLLSIGLQMMLSTGGEE